jgi:hypothetical protein
MFLYGMRYGFYGYYMDPTYILVLAGLLLCMGASLLVQGTYRKYAKVRAASGLTGAQVAEYILRNNGIQDVSIEQISGNLTDHYDPRKKVLRLSEGVYNSNSVAAIGVAAHECGHALQHQTGYAPLYLRSFLVPLTNIGSKLAFPCILLGIIVSSLRVLLPVGILLFGLTVLFALITLPVEFNASRRALHVLRNQGILQRGEIGGAGKVLTAAALTYVASAISAILQLLRLWLLYGGRRRD